MQNHASVVCSHLLATVVLVLASCAGAGDEAVRSSDDTASPASGDDHLLEDLLAQVRVAEGKLTGLAEEFSQEVYDWRPADGVRSSGEVFMHVATINFAFPLSAGHEAPPSTGLTLETLQTAAPAYQSSLSDKPGIVPELEASFENLRAAMQASLGDDLDREVTALGEASTLRAFWVGHVNHLHEHLGQLIAYGRVNGVAPPWSG